MFLMRTAYWCSLALHGGLFVAVVAGPFASATRVRMTPPLVMVQTERTAPPPVVEMRTEPPVCTEAVTADVVVPELLEPNVAVVPTADAWPTAAQPAPPAARRELAAAFALQRVRPLLADAVVTPPVDVTVQALSAPVERVLAIEPGSNLPPRYPPAALRRGQQGTVLLRVTCDEQGKVLAIEVVRSSGHPLLDEAAIDAVRQWRFRNGPGHIEQPVEFRLERAS